VRTHPVMRRRLPATPGVLFALVLAAHAGTGHAQVPAPAGAAAAQAGQPAGADRSAAVDALFTRWHTPDSPGAAVLVLQHGEVVHAKGYGMANLEHGIPIRTNTVFDIASISKQFGAFAIALLEAEGRLQFDDDVRRYVPELPDFGHTITVRHLVHHTSGLRDWPGTLRMAGWDYQDVLSFDQIVRMALHQRELNFVPGSDYAYSNTGYNLLAVIVERVTGQPFAEWTAAHIFRPLGMRDTHFHDDHTRIVRNRADSYRPASGGPGYHNIANSLTALASSSLYTTVEDLARWVRNFDEPVVGNAHIMERMYQRGVLNSGDTITYAFGLMAGSYRGARTVSHGGSWAGFRTNLHRFPDAGLDVIILSNTSEMNAGSMVQRIADIYIPEQLQPPATVAAATPAAATTSQASAPQWLPAAAELQEFAGRYDSDELMTWWTLSVRDGRLVASHFRAGDVVLQPTEPDRFQSGMFGSVRFTRDEAGRITGFTANSDRIRGLRFERR
jgi:CubicO group peptidase (beta-lactamase class C family)